MIKRLCEVFSPSGSEKKMCEFLKAEMSDEFDSTNVDNAGNLILHRAGTGKKLCIECGMDSRGVMVVSKNEDKAFVAGLGGVTPEFLLDKRLFFENGEIGIVRSEAKPTAETKTADLYVEVDTDGIETGAFAAVSSEFCENNRSFFSTDVSAKLAMAAVLEAVKGQKTNLDLTLVFTSQKRVGARGIRAFFENREFDACITVDGILCGGGVKSGSGCAIVAVDGRDVADKELRDATEALADKCGIKAQLAVTEENLCMEAISKSGSGVRCIALGIPTLFKGQRYESVLKSDFDEAVRLLKGIIRF